MSEAAPKKHMTRIKHVARETTASRPLYLIWLFFLQLDKLPGDSRALGRDNFVVDGVCKRIGLYYEGPGAKQEEGSGSVAIHV